MKVLFINPNSAPALNLGLTYVMSAVEEEHEIKLLDLGLYGKDYAKALRAYLSTSTAVVAFSAFTHNFHKALQVASFIKNDYPGIKIIFGGIHPTLCPEEVAAYPQIDALCIGEGERALKEYLDCLNRDKPVLVKGIWIRGKNGSWIKNPLRPFEDNLDSLSFPNWDHWDLDYYLKRINDRFGFIASRGCPYNCTFCSNPALRKAVPGNFVRYRSASQVIAEIELNIAKYRRFGLEYIRFDDEIFGLDKGFLKDYCSLYIEKGLHRQFPWFCQTRADLLTCEYVDLIAAAGCAIVGLGIESGDERIRCQVYKKCVSNDTIAQAVGRLKKRNISYLFYMMYNSPHTDGKERQRTKEMVKNLKPLRATFSAFMFLPKTELGQVYGRALTGAKAQPQNQQIGVAFKADKFLSLVYLLQRLRNSCGSGLRARGAGFITDLMKFVSLKLIRFELNIFSFSGLERMLFQLEYFTIFKYAIANSRKNFRMHR